MNLIFFDDECRDHLLPFTFTRPQAELRIGVLTPREKWVKCLGAEVFGYRTADYLQEKFLRNASAGENHYINGSICPNATLAGEVKSLEAGESLWKDNLLLAACAKGDVDPFTVQHKKKESRAEGFIRIKRVWDIFSQNGQAISDDFTLLTTGRKSAPLNDTNRVLGAENIFVEEGVKCDFAILNASTGPIYLGRDSEVMEGTIIRGPFALCEHAGTKMAAKIYGPTTVGPYCKVGGEVNNSVLFSYSNKGHDGFLGNAVIGEWCNLGADTNNSNLKNNYQEVKMWSYAEKRFAKTGLQFCGLMMGDHSKAGINTMFNTGTVVGVAANVFGAGFPRNFIPSFAWGGAHGFETFQLPKVFEMAEAMSGRRGIAFTETDRKIMEHVFAQTASNRFWEKQQA